MAAVLKGSKVKKKAAVTIGLDTKTQTELFLMLAPGTVLMLLFSIIPLFGLTIAFTAFRPVMGFAGIFNAPWNEFLNFRLFFNSSQFWPMVRNTLGINLLGSFFSMLTVISFALLLNELVNKRFKSFVQTITFMPHFISWVVFGGLFINLLQPDAVINNILMFFGMQEPILFLASPRYFWGVAIVTAILKDLGWGAVLYLAAIAGIDPVLYEAATVDGAGRFSQMRHVTLPGMLPTIMIMAIFAVAGMLNNNFTQIFVFQNVLNMPSSQVIATYVFQIGLQQFQFGIGAAASLVMSLFAVVLLVCANYSSNKLTKSGLF